MTRPVVNGSHDPSRIWNPRKFDGVAVGPQSISNSATALQEGLMGLAVEDVVATGIAGTLASPEPAGRNKILTLVIAHRHEIASAGIEALLQARGHSVIARCVHEDDLLRSVEAYRPDMIILAKNIVRQEVRKTVLLLRARHYSVRIIFLLEERDAIMAADLRDLDVEGILLSAASVESVFDCVESVRQGRNWVDPNLLRHLAMARGPSQVASDLTSREAEIAHLVSRGLRNKEIARELHLSEGTVKMHLHNIYRKLGLCGRTHLALSTAGTCEPMASGNGVRSPSKPVCPDYADFQKDKEPTIFAVEFAVDQESIRLLSEERLNTPMPTNGIRPRSTAS